jgi:hypothetical protein
MAFSLAVLLASLPLAAAPPPAGTCLKLVHPMAAGSFAMAADLAEAACTAPKRAGFRYDAAARAVRAVRDLRQDEVVEAVPASLLAGARPGQVLTLSVRIGAVLVARNVVALQPARPGERLFVRAEDGKVFTALCPEPAQ